MKSFPWDSIATSMGEDGFPRYDRNYTAEDLCEVYEAFFSDGVFLNEPEAFAVTADDGMNVTVQSGKCFISGTVGWENASRTIALQAPSESDRIDTVVLRRNANKDERKIDIYVKQGTPGTVPAEPSLTRNGNVYELGLANIFVASNDEAVSQQRITDTRLDDSRCGMVTPLLDIDTTTFFAQIQAAIDANVGELQEQTERAIGLSNAALEGGLAAQIAKEAVRQALEAEHPPGSLYMALDEAADPNGRLPGTWELIDGYFLRAAGSPGTGGSDSMTLAIANMPNHGHAPGTYVAQYGGAHAHSGGVGRSFVAVSGGTKNIYQPGGANQEYTGIFRINSGGGHNHVIIGESAAVGGGKAFDNRPKFMNIYVWQRTA